MASREKAGEPRRRRERDLVAGKHAASSGGGGGGTARQELMQQMDQKDTRTNMEILGNTISKAAEATQIADATLVQLATQREQMLRIDDDLATINQTLANCEKRIKGLNSNFFTGLFVSNKGNAPQESDTRYRAPSSTKSAAPSAPLPRKDSAASKPMPALSLPSHVHDSATCASDRTLQAFLEAHKAKFEFAKGEKVMFHYCNTRQPLVLDQTNKCILLTNQRLLRVLDGNLVNKVFLPEVESVRHVPAKPLGYDALSFKYSVTGKEELVEVWGCEVAKFFRDMIDLTITERDQRRRTRTDADLAKLKGPRSEMSELERKYEEDMVQEDEQLEVLGKLVEGLGERAKEMGQELDSQKPLVEHLHTRVDATTERLNNNQKKVDKILSK